MRLALLHFRPSAKPVLTYVTAVDDIQVVADADLCSHVDPVYAKTTGALANAVGPEPCAM